MRSICHVWFFSGTFFWLRRWPPHAPPAPRGLRISWYRGSVLRAASTATFVTPRKRWLRLAHSVGVPLPPPTTGS